MILSLRSFEDFAKNFKPPGWVEKIRDVANLPYSWEERTFQDMVAGTHEWEAWYLKEAWDRYICEVIR